MDAALRHGFGMKKDLALHGVMGNSLHPYGVRALFGALSQDFVLGYCPSVPPGRIGAGGGVCV
jgi:hypothetical protein